MEESKQKIFDALSSWCAQDDPVYEVVERLFDFKQSFEFDSNLSEAELSKNKFAVCATCQNCQFLWIVGFLPSQNFNRVMERYSFCVRCYEAEKILFKEYSIRKNSRLIKSHRGDIGIDQEPPGADEKSNIFV